MILYSGIFIIINIIDFNIYLTDDIHIVNYFIRNSVGRTDLWQGSYDDIRSSVRGKLFKFDDKIDVYPGHGPSSNIGYEKTHNFSV